MPGGHRFGGTSVQSGPFPEGGTLRSRTRRLSVAPNGTGGADPETGADLRKEQGPEGGCTGVSGVKQTRKAEKVGASGAKRVFFGARSVRKWRLDSFWQQERSGTDPVR